MCSVKVNKYNYYKKMSVSEMYLNAFTSHTLSRNETSKKGGMSRKGTTPHIICRQSKRGSLDKQYKSIL